MDELELDAVGVVDEDRVVAGRVVVLAWAALDLGADVAGPVGDLLDRLPARRREGEVVQSDRVAVGSVETRVALAQPDRPVGEVAAEVNDPLPLLADDAADVDVTERAQQSFVEGQAALQRGDDEIDMMDAAWIEDDNSWVEEGV